MGHALELIFTPQMILNYCGCTTTTTLQYLKSRFQVACYNFSIGLIMMCIWETSKLGEGYGHGGHGCLLSSYLGDIEFCGSHYRVANGMPKDYFHI